MSVLIHNTGIGIGASQPIDIDILEYLFCTVLNHKGTNNKCHILFYIWLVDERNP